MKYSSGKGRRRTDSRPKKRAAAPLPAPPPQPPSCCRSSASASPGSPAMKLLDPDPELPEPAYALLDRGVSREQRRDPAAAERLDDVERLGRLADLHRARPRPRLPRL